MLGLLLTIIVTLFNLILVREADESISNFIAISFISLPFILYITGGGICFLISIKKSRSIE